MQQWLLVDPMDISHTCRMVRKAPKLGNPRYFHVLLACCTFDPRHENEDRRGVNRVAKADSCAKLTGGMEGSEI